MNQSNYAWKVGALGERLRITRDELRALAWGVGSLTPVASIRSDILGIAFDVDDCLRRLGEQ